MWLRLSELQSGWARVVLAKGSVIGEEDRGHAFMLNHAHCLYCAGTQAKISYRQGMLVCSNDVWGQRGP